MNRCVDSACWLSQVVADGLFKWEGDTNIFRTDLASLVSFAKTGAALAPKDVASEGTRDLFDLLKTRSGASRSFCMLAWKLDVSWR